MVADAAPGMLALSFDTVLWHDTDANADVSIVLTTKCSVVKPDDYRVGNQSMINLVPLVESTWKDAQETRGEMRC